MSLALVLAATAALTPQQETRATALDNEIRCIVCENEPISQSTTDIAGEMRNMVRERIAAGDSDAQVRSFFRERYGDFVLLRPPMDGRTAVLWATPLTLLAVGLVTLWIMSRRRSEEMLAPEQSER